MQHSADRMSRIVRAITNLLRGINKGQLVMTTDVVVYYPALKNERPKANHRWLSHGSALYIWEHFTKNCEDFRDGLVILA